VSALDSLPDEETESARIVASRSRVARRGLTLTFTVSAGRTVAITEDTIPGDGYQRYRYAGHLTSAPFHVVVVSYIEGRAVLLVHESSGKQVLVDAIPSFHRRASAS